MTNLQAIQSREQFKYAVAGEIAEGKNVYETRVFEAQNKPLHDLIGVEKENWGIQNNPSGHSGKFRQIACAEAQMELGLDVDYYNGAGIDGLSYMKAYLKENEFTETDLAAWLIGSFLLDRHWKDNKWLDVTISEHARMSGMFTFLDGYAQKWNKLRNKHKIDLSYREFMTHQKEVVFENVNKLIDNSLVSAPDEYTGGIMVEGLQEHILYINRCVPKALFKKLKEDSSEFNLNTIVNGSTIMIGSRFVVTILQEPDCTYNLYNVFNSRMVGNFSSLASIELMIAGIVLGLKKTLWEHFSPEISIIPPKHDFAIFV